MLMTTTAAIPAHPIRRCGECGGRLRIHSTNTGSATTSATPAITHGQPSDRIKPPP